MDKIPTEYVSLTFCQTPDLIITPLLQVSLEKTGSQLDNLLRAEKMGWISSAESWIEIRTLRNKLVHEYMDSAPDLLQALIVALKSSGVIIKSGVYG